MKLLLFCHLGQIQEYAEYVNAFKKLDSVQSLLLTMGEEEYALGQSVGAFDTVKDILPERSELDSAETDPSGAARALRELEDRIGSNFVNRDILTDRYFLEQPRLDMDPRQVPLIWTESRTKQFMCAVYQRLEREIADFAPDFLFVETSFAPTRMAWRLAHEKGVPAGSFMPVRFWQDRLYLETGIGYDWQQARAAYREMPDKPMAGAELAQVKQRLETIVREKTKPEYLKSDHAKGAPGFLKRLYGVRLFAGVSPWLGRRARTAGTNPQVLPGELFSPIAKYARHRNGQKTKRYLRNHETPFSKLKGRKYAIYFLHVQPELTVEGMAFDYQDQVNTLRTILASLPADMELVVKEHTPMLGYRPLDAYAQLAHMPGIVIADTHEDSHKLITHACVVVTLTGTVALEAVLYGIPAIVLGSTYFDCFNGIYKPADLHALRELLSAPDKLAGATEEDALRALGSMLRASKPGRPPRVDVRLQPIDPDSARVMMSALRKLAPATAQTQSTLRDECQ